MNLREAAAELKRIATERSSAAHEERTWFKLEMRDGTDIAIVSRFVGRGANMSLTIYTGSSIAEAVRAYRDVATTKRDYDYDLSDSNDIVDESCEPDGGDYDNGYACADCGRFVFGDDAPREAAFEAGLCEQCHTDSGIAAAEAIELARDAEAHP